MLIVIIVSTGLPLGCRYVELQLEEECHEEAVTKCVGDTDNRSCGDHGCEGDTRTCDQGLVTKQCDIVMVEVMTPVTMEHCQESVAQCHQRQCSLHYRTQCINRSVFRDIVEDVPECWTDTVTSCDDNAGSCRQVKVNRCKIVQKKRRKRIPETRCFRRPYRDCVRLPCKSKTPKICEKKVHYVKEFVPKEECNFVEAEDCVEDLDTCDEVMVTNVTVCSPPSEQRTVKHLECNGTIVSDDED